MQLRLDQDPAFGITSPDGQSWIDPYTGSMVPAPDGIRQAAEAYLVEHRPWESKALLPVEHLEVIRWHHDLMVRINQDRRFRLFVPERGWLNPFNGRLIEGITLSENGSLPAQQLTAMAQALAASPEAAAGKLLDEAELTRRRDALLSDDGQKITTAAVELNDDLKRASDLQQHMLSDLPDLPGWTLGVHFAAHSGVSGDFYEFLPLDDGRYLVLLGDVSGHGVQAALVVATALKTLRLLARSTSDLTRLLTQLNDEVKPDLLPGQFITIFAGLLDPDAATLDVALAGHHPVLIANPEGEVVLRKFGKPGMAVGLIGGALFGKSLKVQRIELQPGDLMLQYTDGIIEAIDENDEDYGLHRVCASLFGLMGDDVQAVVDGMAAEVSDFANGDIDDDVTILGLWRDLPPDPDDIDA